MCPMVLMEHCSTTLTLQVTSIGTDDLVNPLNLFWGVL